MHLSLRIDKSHESTVFGIADQLASFRSHQEAAISVLPIVVIVLLLCLTIAPVGTDLLLCFLIGTIFVIVGIGFFSLGAEASMTPIGNRIGTALTKTRNLPLILIVSFLLGFAVTIAEPDLQVLAETVPHINNTVLLVTVGLGVGFFLSVCMLRIVTGVKLRWLLIAFYGIVFILASRHSSRTITTMGRTEIAASRIFSMILIRFAARTALFLCFSALAPFFVRWGK